MKSIELQTRYVLGSLISRDRREKYAHLLGADPMPTPQRGQATIDIGAPPKHT
jgi:hypothetical protein